jgi:hypothetical protein
MPLCPSHNPSARQRPVAQRLDDLLELAEATARALLDNAWDHGDHLPPHLITTYTQRLATIQQLLDQTTIERG